MDMRKKLFLSTVLAGVAFYGLNHPVKEEKIIEEKIQVSNVIHHYDFFGFPMGVQFLVESGNSTQGSHRYIDYRNRWYSLRNLADGDLIITEKTVGKTCVGLLCEKLFDEERLPCFEIPFRRDRYVKKVNYKLKDIV